MEPGAHRYIIMQGLRWQELHLQAMGLNPHRGAAPRRYGHRPGMPQAAAPLALADAPALSTACAGGTRGRRAGESLHMLQRPPPLPLREPAPEGARPAKRPRRFQHPTAFTNS